MIKENYSENGQKIECSLKNETSNIEIYFFVRFFQLDK